LTGAGSTRGAGGNGAQGIIAITYTPCTSCTVSGGSVFMIGMEQ
jgi:hypothetical protein